MSEDIECTICMEEMNDNTFITSCNHKYHKYCLDKWFLRNNICPMCRTEITDYTIDIENILENGEMLVINNFQDNPLIIRRAQRRFGIKEFILIMIFILILIVIFSK